MATEKKAQRLRVTCATCGVLMDSPAVIDQDVSFCSEQCDQEYGNTSRPHPPEGR